MEKEEIEDGPIVNVERREGTLLYSDDKQTKGQHYPMLSSLTVATVLQEGGETRTIYRALGPASAIAEGIAIYIFQNPGMYEAIQGMLQMYVARRQTGR